MSEVLYRKYRPQTFGEVIGQGVIKTILQNALKTGQIAHAYLFTGPRGVGKTSVARIFARASPFPISSPLPRSPGSWCESTLTERGPAAAS